MHHHFSKHARLRPYTETIRSFTSVNAPFTVSVFLRISSYTVTDIYDRNPVTWNPAKYGRIRSVYNMDTVVYGVVYGVRNARPGYILNGLIKYVGKT